MMSNLHAQTIEKKTKYTTKQKLIISAFTIQQLGSYYLEYKWWWQGDYHPFVFKSDGWANNYSLGIDKTGHFFTSYAVSSGLNELLKWGEFSDKSRRIAVFTIPALYALSIEIGDGFTSYAFSYSDLIMNMSGITYALLQDAYPALQNFNFKFSYFPSKRFIDNHFNGWTLTEDYDGHIYWFTSNLKYIAPTAVKKYIPELINLGIGYGIVNYLGGGPMQREFFIGIDYNLSSIKTKSQALNSMIKIADKFHFPAPGYKKEGSQSFKLHGLILN